MDLVTFTDHDTIDGCLELLDREGPLDNFFISEEVSTRDPRTRATFHVTVFGIDEAHHREIQRLRGNVLELSRYLSHEKIPASLNHVGSSLLRGEHSLERLIEVTGAFALIETRNGAQMGGSNGVAELLASKLEKEGPGRGRTGGSDAHTTRRIGEVWTRACAENRESFLEALSEGRVEPGGSPSKLAPIVGDVYRIVGQYYGDLLSNRRGHFTREERRVAAACALLSLPLHLVGLPATGVVFRQLRVWSAARRLTHAFSQSEQRTVHPAMAEVEEGLSV
jgi:predicted metal-dependent phosphoesterase TrpH